MKNKVIISTLAFVMVLGGIGLSNPNELSADNTNNSRETQARIEKARVSKELELRREMYVKLKASLESERDESKRRETTKEIRASFVDRFSFTFNKIVDFQNAIENRIIASQRTGKDFSTARRYLNESKSFNVQISADIKELSELLAKEPLNDAEAREIRSRVIEISSRLKANIKNAHSAIRTSLEEFNKTYSSTKTEGRSLINSNL